MTLTSYSYNELNQLQSWSRSGTTTTYEYDPNGNRVAEITGSVTKQLWYDVENRLIGYNTPQPMLANSGSTITSGSAPIVVHDKYFSRGAQIPGSGTVPPEGMPLGNGTVYPPRSGPYPATVHPSWGNDNPAEMYWVSTDNQKISGLEWVGFWGSDVHYLLLEAQRVKETTPRQVQTWMAYKDIMSGTKPTGPVLDFGIPWAYEHVPFDPWDDGAPESEPGVGEPAPGNGTLFTYDYRTRRVRLKTASVDTMFVFSGGVSVKEFENGSATPSVEYVRGSDWGGGVGGILYTLRSGSASFTHYNHRGDVTAKTDATGSLTYQSTYDAFGTRSAEVGSTPDREKSNTKPEDLPGYANEGFRFGDLETGVFLTRDPAGFVDGPNLYTYVVQNPWTKFDPRGLKSKKEYEKELEERQRSIELQARLAHSKNSLAVSRQYFEVQSKELNKIRGKIANIEATAKKWNDAAGKDVLKPLGKSWETIDDESFSFGVLNREDPKAFLKSAHKTAAELKSRVSKSSSLQSALKAAAAMNPKIDENTILTIMTLETRGHSETTLGAKQFVKSVLERGNMENVSIGPGQLKGPARKAAGLTVDDAKTYEGAAKGISTWLSDKNPNINSDFNETQRAAGYNGAASYGVQFQLVNDKLFP